MSESASLLLDTFQSSGFNALELQLRGYFHWKGYGDGLDALIEFCDQNAELCFALCPGLRTPTRSTVTGEYWIRGPLHHHVIKAILSEQSNWIGAFNKLLSSNPVEKVRLTSIGPEPCVPLFATRSHNVNFTQITGTESKDPEGSTWHPSLGQPSSTFDDGATEEYIAVTGMACQLPGAADMDEFWSLLRAGHSQHREVPPERFKFNTPWREDDGRRKWYGNFIQDYDQFDERFFGKGPRESAYTDPQNRLLLQVAYQAVEQAGYFRRRPRGFASEGEHMDTSVGCYVGVGLGDYEHNVACHPPTAYTAVGNLRAFVAGRISHYFGWSGPSLTIDTACSSSAVAVHNACRAILGGECRAALAGGVNVMTSPEWFQNLAAASFLSPTGQCKPFDSEADGYCRGEAVGAVYLKKLSSALEDGDVIYGIIAGSAVSQNQNTTPITVPNAPSLASLFGDVIRRSRLRPKDISYVEAHGTGTPLGDPVEYEGIRRVLGGDNGCCGGVSLGSVKGLVGHSEAASGVVALLKTLLMMHHGCIPPQASFRTLRHDIGARYSDRMSICTQPTPWKHHFKAALINNYGASGSNAAIIVAQSPRAMSCGQTVSRVSSTGSSVKAQIYPLALFASDEDGLTRYAARLLPFLRSRTDVSPSDIAFQLNRQSNWSFPHCLIFSFGTLTELMEKLEDVCEKRAAAANARTSLSVGHTVPPSRPVILCFGGQTSMLVGLDTDLYNRVKIFRKYLDECNEVCVSLGEGIYPDIFQRTRLRDIVRLQLALFSIQYACAKSWISCGVKVSAVVGHSFGELTALCISGVLSLSDALAVVAGRARLIRDCWGTDRGSMLAVKADGDVTEKWLIESHLRCPEEPAATIACFNGGRSFTVAGSTMAINAALELAQSDGYFSLMDVRRLDVTHAFHSSLVDPLQDSLQRLTEGVAFNEPIIPIELATETGSHGEAFSDFISGHMRRPVYFGQAVQRLFKRFPSAIWLEAGSSSTVTNMVIRALGKSHNTHFQPLNITRASDSMQDLTETTIKLWRQGLDVTFWPHHKSQVDEYRPLILPPYQFRRSRHWVELKTPQLALPRTEHLRLSQADPQALWTLESVVGEDLEHRTARFRIHMDSERFKDILCAHKALGAHALCPSTVQLHIIVDALTSLIPEYVNGTMQPRVLGMNSHAPMTSQSEGRVTWLNASMKNAADHMWEWTMSSANADDGGRSIRHSSGTVAFHHEDNREFLAQFSEHEALGLRDCSRSLLNDWDVDEILQGRSIYRSFSEIVEYGDMFCHIRKLAGKGNESAGRVAMTCSGDSWMDFALADCFCQVAGIYINMAGDRTNEELFISNKIGQWLRSPRVRYEKFRERVWEVYARHHQPSPQSFVSDIFVFDEDDGSLLEVIIGVQYQKVGKVQLGKALLKATEKDSAGTLPQTSGMSNEAAGLKVNSDGPTLSMSNRAITQPTDGPSLDVDSTESSVRAKLTELVANLSGLEADQVRDDSELVDIGIDSLMVMELARDIESMFKCKTSPSQLQDLRDFRGLVSFIQTALSLTHELRTTPARGVDPVPADYDLEPPPTVSPPEASLTNGHSARLSMVPLPTDAFIDTFCEFKAMTDEYIFNHGLGGYAESVLPTLDLVCLSYIRKAFKQLGIGCSPSPNDSSQTDHRDTVYLPRYGKLVALLRNLLQSHPHSNGGMDNTQEPEALLHHLRTAYPGHSHDYDLIELVGPKLADCLTGDVEGVQLIFGSAEGRETVSAMYGQSPINLVWIRQLRDLLQGLMCRLLPSLPGDTCEPLRILEVGAGTTGTSAQIIPMLAQLGVPVQYTVTDISSSLVAAARKRFRQYEWVHYRALDLEKPVATELLQSQHIVLATNCVHATRDIVETACRLREMLRSDGALLMLEMTQTLVWVDLIFGLLEGWWQFEDGRSHALVPASMWKETLLRAGYGHVDWTDGQCPEASIQRLILATASCAVQESNGSVPPSSTSHEPSVDHPGHNGVGDREAVIENYVRDFTSDIIQPSPSQVNGLSSSKQDHAASTPSSAPVVVLITGATGSLGSHLVQHFAEQPEVSAVICLNRHHGTDASLRQAQALSSRGIHLDAQAASKLEVYQTDTARARLGLPESAYDDIARRVTHVVHSAWPMSMTRPVQGYEPQFKTMRNLIMLAHDAQKASSLRQSQTDFPVAQFTFQFISSIAVVGLDPARSGEPRVAEEPMPAASVLPNGYGEAKLVCERMLNETLGRDRALFRPMAVRLGQVAGSRATGYWNPVEHFPSMVKTAQTMGSLPQLQGVSETALLITPLPFQRKH